MLRQAVSLTGGIIAACQGPLARHVLRELLPGKIPIGNLRWRLGPSFAAGGLPHTENGVLSRADSPEEFEEQAKLREEVERVIAARDRAARTAPGRPRHHGQ